MDHDRFHGTGTIFFTHGGRYVAEWENGIVLNVSV
jgi:hypothetical protein